MFLDSIGRVKISKKNHSYPHSGTGYYYSHPKGQTVQKEPLFTAYWSHHQGIRYHHPDPWNGTYAPSRNFGNKLPTDTVHHPSILTNLATLYGKPKTSQLCLSVTFLDTMRSAILSSLLPVKGVYKNDIIIYQVISSCSCVHKHAVGFSVCTSL